MIHASLIEHGKRTSLMSVLLAVLLAFAYAPLARFYRSRWEGWLLAVGWAAMGVNLIRAVLGHWFRMVRLPFRRFDLSLEADSAHPGGSFRLDSVCEARRDVALEWLSATLECITESLTDKAQKAQKAQKAEKGRRERAFHRDRQVMAETVGLRAGESRRFSAVLPVPASGPTSYKDPQRRIGWRIVVSARVSGWGELRDELEVTVEPR